MIHLLHVVGALLLSKYHVKLGIHPDHLKYAYGLQALSMLLSEFPDLKAKIKGWLGAAQKAVGVLLIGVLALSAVGCSLTPQQIENDTAIGSSLLLNGATILDRAKAAEIKSDAVEVAKAINAVVVPTFQPGANAGALLNSTVSQVVPHLQARLSALKHGPEILGIIALLQTPLASALGVTSSPAALMSRTSQMNALAFFSGISQGISTFTGDATLMPPPLPTMPIVPPVAPPVVPQAIPPK